MCSQTIGDADVNDDWTSSLIGLARRPSWVADALSSQVLPVIKPTFQTALFPESHLLALRVLGTVFKYSGRFVAKCVILRLQQL